MQPRELQSISRLTTGADSLTFISSLLEITLLILAAHTIFKLPCLYSFIAMNPLLYLDPSSTELDVFYVERSSMEGGPARTNTPAVLISTQLSRAMARETIINSPVASLEPQSVTIDSDSNEPKILYGFGNQHPVVTPNLNDPIQRVGYFGRDSTRRRIQPPITAAV